MDNIYMCLCVLSNAHTHTHMRMRLAGRPDGLVTYSSSLALIDKGARQQSTSRNEYSAESVLKASRGTDPPLRLAISLNKILY